MNLDPIKEAVRQAAKLCRQIQTHSLTSSTKHSKEKGYTEPVTLADYGSQAIICRALSQHFPDDAVISEEAGAQFLELTDENARAQVFNLLTNLLDVNVTQDDVVRWLDFGSGRDDAQRTWVIDPIDGTKGFINLRHYSIGVGILDADGQPVASVIGAPGYAENMAEEGGAGMIFYAQDNAAYAEPLAGGEATPITVSSRADNGDVRVVQSYEKSHASKSRMATVREKADLSEAHIYELDSMEKYALVACGDADVYLRLPNINSTRPHMSWDHAAGVALVHAAGGKATDVDGSPLVFSDGRIMPNQGMLVSNGVLHERIVAATQALLAEEAAD